MKQKRSKIEPEALWKERIAGLEASGLTQKDWCAQNRIAETTLRYWRRKLAKSKSANANPTGFFRAVPMPESGLAAEHKVPDVRPAGAIGAGVTIKAVVIGFRETDVTETVCEALRALQSL